LHTVFSRKRIESLTYAFRLSFQIKGSERRLASSTKKTEKSGKDTTVELSSTGLVIKCSGKKCERFFKHCTDDGDDGVRNFSGLTSSDSGSGNSRRLKKTSSSSDDDVAVFRVGDVEDCVIERTRGGGSSSSSSSTGSSSSSSSDTGAAKKEKTSSSSTSKDTSAAKKEKTSEKKRSQEKEEEATAKSPKLRRVLHSSSSSSSKKGKKADTRIEFTSRGGLVSCSGKNCKKFIKRCTDGKKHLKKFDLRTFFDGSTTKSTGKSRHLKKSDDNDNIYIRFINMNDVDMDADGCFLV